MWVSICYNLILTIPISSSIKDSLCIFFIVFLLILLLRKSKLLITLPIDNSVNRFVFSNFSNMNDASLSDEKDNSTLFVFLLMFSFCNGYFFNNSTNFLRLSSETSSCSISLSETITVFGVSF